MIDHAAALPLVSIIIPTHNRAGALQRLLESLRRQTYPAACCEIIVVDDGSALAPADAPADDPAWPVRTLRQAHQGATLARNWGVRHSRGEILIFFDDDVWASPAAVSSLVQALCTHDQTLAIAALLPTLPAAEATPFAHAYGQIAPEPAAPLAEIALDQGAFAPFTACMTGGLAVWRRDFYALGMFQDPTPGLWPNWDDLDFGYRAHCQGLRFWRSDAARVYHYDQTLRTLDGWCARIRRASHAAVWLFRRHPDLAAQLPMFTDKQPLALPGDGPALATRKLLRRTASSRPAVWLLTRLAAELAARRPRARGLPLLYRWIVSAHIYAGYRAGLAQMAQSTAVTQSQHVLL